MADAKHYRAGRNEVYPEIDREAEQLAELYRLQGLYEQEEEQRATVFAQWQNDPVGFVTDVLGGFLWSAQKKICNAVRDCRHVAVQSCHGIGKSFTAAQIIAWWIATNKPGDAFVVTSAPTAPQVRAILWREIRRAHRKGHLPGRTTQTEWKIGEELVGFGRKPADYDEHSFQGIHARKVLIVLDEACGIPKSLWTAAEALATNEHSRIFVIGNPDDPVSEFAKKCGPGTDWKVIRVDAFDTPNFTGEIVPNDLRELLISPEWVEERRKEWTEESPLWTSKVRGEFPEVATDTLIPLSWARRAIERRLPKAADEANVLGCDIARWGEDLTVITHRRGGYIRTHSTYGKQDLMKTTGAIVKALTETDAVEARVDDVGLGGGVTDRLLELKKPVEPCNAGSAAADKERFYNARAEWYWNLRSRFENGEIDIPDDDALVSQLTSIKYELTSRGQIKIESKDDMKKRGMKSPDLADAYMLAYADDLGVAPPDIF